MKGRIPYMSARQLKGGKIAYYWIPKRVGPRVGMHSEPLGQDYSKAAERAIHLNKQLKRALEELKVGASARPLTVDRLIDLYQKDNDMYLSLQPKTRRGYDKNLRVVSREIGEYQVRSFTPLICHRWYEALRKKYSLSRSNALYTQAKMVFNLAVRETMIERNPFRDVRLKTPKKRTRQMLARSIWTRTHFDTFVSKCFELGEDMMGIAAMMAFELCQREGDIIGSTQIDDSGIEYWHAVVWADYDGRYLRIVQSKTDVPVYVDIATYLPELKQRIDALARVNSQIVNYVPKGKVGQRGLEHPRPYKEDHFRHVFRKIRKAAELPEDLKFMNLRHGGLTELAGLEAGDDVKMALSGHRQRATLDRYVFPTSQMADRALAVRTQNKTVQTDVQTDVKNANENIEKIQ